MILWDDSGAGGVGGGGGGVGGGGSGLIKICRIHHFD